MIWFAASLFCVLYDKFVDTAVDIHLKIENRIFYEKFATLIENIWNAERCGTSLWWI